MGLVHNGTGTQYADLETINERLLLAPEKRDHTASWVNHFDREGWWWWWWDRHSINAATERVIQLGKSDCMSADSQSIQPIDFDTE